RPGRGAALMRPSTLLMALAIGALALSMLAIGIGALPDATGLWFVAALHLMMLADIALGRAPGGWSVALSGPGEIFTGETAQFTNSVSAGAPIRRDLRARLDWPDGLEGPEEVRLAPSPDGAAAEFEVRARRRGLWPVARLWLGWRSPLGLIGYCP